MKKGFIFAGLSLIVIVTVLAYVGFAAADFELSVEAIKDRIRPDETAKFRLTITNNHAAAQTFKIYSLDIEWDVTTTTLTISSGEEKTLTVLAKPLKKFEPGVYGVKLYVKSLTTGEFKEKLLLVSIGEEENLSYAPAVSMDIDMIEVLAPEEVVNVKVNLENKNILKLDNLSLVISSELGAFNKVVNLQLDSLEKKTIELNFKIPKNQQPKEYKVMFDLLHGNKALASEIKLVEVSESTPPFSREESVERKFLKIIKTVTFTNDGNVRNAQTVEIPARAFTSTIPKASIVSKDGKKFFTWEIELAPGESSSIVLITNYRIIFYLIVLALVCLFIYAKFRQVAIVKKTVSDVVVGEGGGIAKARVMIDLVNKSKKELRNVDILDILPNIAKVGKEFPEGTLKPSKILAHKEKGTILNWKIDVLAPNEERLIAYDIESRLPVIGGLRLPKARVRFEVDGKKKKVYSNSVRIS
ncbi:hypothetical protein DRJ19_03495 [Candidatus Woesearchaeota archaeon]|nr:MAG: hypothetical protein DRJ19_03495 [Candidatus Woesearchaeota archaeon]